MAHLTIAYSAFRALDPSAALVKLEVRLEVPYSINHTHNGIGGIAI